MRTITTRSSLKTILRGGGTIYIDPGVYKLSGSIDLPEGTSVYAHGANFVCESTEYVIGLNSGCSWQGGAFKAKIIGQAASDIRSVFRIGNYAEWTPIWNTQISNVAFQLDSFKPISGIWILGAAKNVKISNIHCDDCERLVGVISSHWGCVEKSDPTLGTAHPANLLYENISARNIGHEDDNEGSIITSSASVNVIARNLSATHAWIGLHVTTGDFGMLYSIDPCEVVNTFENVTIGYCRLAGLLVKSFYAEHIVNLSGATIHGNGQGLAALCYQEADNITIKNSRFTSFPSIVNGSCKYCFLENTLINGQIPLPTRSNQSLNYKT